MRTASDVLEAIAAFWLVGTVFALSRWASEYGTAPSDSAIARKRAKDVPDAISYLAFAACFAFVGLIVRTW